jgi:pimeloyl-ACP methyl ester carboxylesterase
MPRVIDRLACKVAYDVRGAGPPVLFIQGVGVHGDGWLPQVNELSDRYACASFDNRGIGQSQPATDRLTVEGMADDARAVLDALGWPRAHVVGHSLGGLIALHLALAARDRVQSLALLCTFSGGPHAAPLTPRMVWLGARTRLGTRRMRRHAFLRLVMPKAALAGRDLDALAAELVPLFGHDLADQAPVTGYQLRAMRSYDATPRLRELAGLPTLVVSAAHDPIAPPRAGRVIADGIPGARFVEYADASHGLPIQFPGRVNALLREHWAGNEGP